MFSVSSSYNDLMPQFLRAIRMLCSLHSSFAEANSASLSVFAAATSHGRHNNVPSSLPASPGLGGADERARTTPTNVRRTGSFGSILDSPVVGGGAEQRGGGGASGGGGGGLLRFRGHRRSHSSSQNQSDSGSSRFHSDSSPAGMGRLYSESSATGSGGSSSSSSNRFKNSHSESGGASPTCPGEPKGGTFPFRQQDQRGGGAAKCNGGAEVTVFDPLEVVWGSLECWFDLVKVEVDRVQNQQNQQEQRQQEGEGTAEDVKPRPLATPTITLEDAKEEVEDNSSDDDDGVVKSKRKRSTLKLESSSALAAAIVKSAPLYRRQVFLQPSHSFDQSAEGGGACSAAAAAADSDLKRRSWHVERVTARMLSVLDEKSLTTLPAFNRSLSNDSTAAGKIRMLL